MIRFISTYWPQLLAVLSGLALASAMVIEHILHRPACHLCRYQQYVYAVLLVVNIGALIWQSRGRISARPGRNYAFWLSAALISAGLFFALWQVGVEHHWLPVPEGCLNSDWLLEAFGSGANINAADLTLKAMQYKKPTCDQVQMYIAGLSLAEINAVMNLILLTGVVAVALKARR